MTTLLNGLLGGGAAGLVAALAVQAMASSDARPSALAGVADGALAGLGFVAVELSVAGVLGVPPSLGEALGAAVGWSALLCLGLLASRRLPRSGGANGGVPVVPAARLLIAYHLAFGVGLGLWVRLTWIT